jgi:membrane protease YdiL (CAAX protease family)
MNKKTFPYIAIAYVLVFLFIQVVSNYLVLAVNKLISDEPTEGLTPLATIIALAIFTLVSVALFLKMKWAEVSRNYIMTRPWFTLFWSVIAALGAIIPSAYMQELMPEWPDAIQRMIEQSAQQMMGIMNTPGGYAVICLLAPIGEELVFRGAVLHKLLEWKPERRWLMITFSAVLFAVAHMNPAQIIHPLLIGLLLGWMYERTGSIIPGVAYHWANNTAAYLLARLYQDPDITVTQIMGSQSRALMAVGFSLLIFIPAIYQLNVWMKKPEKPYFKR